MKKLTPAVLILATVAAISIFFIEWPHREDLHYEEMRIISLGPYATENLVLMGLEDNIIGLTIHDLPERRKGKESIGTLLDPNMEKILTLRPDIVVASKEGNRPESVAQLNNLGIATLTLEELYTFDDICNNFTKLGEALNRAETSEQIITHQTQRLQAIQDRIHGKTPQKAFFILGFKPLFTTGSATYINAMIENAGGVNIFSDTEKKWFSVNPEEVVKRDPDIIIFIDMEEGVELFKEKMATISAVRQDRIHGLESSTVGSPTPKTYVNAVDAISRMLYPEQ